MLKNTKEFMAKHKNVKIAEEEIPEMFQWSYKVQILDRNFKNRSDKANDMQDFCLEDNKLIEKHYAKCKRGNKPYGNKLQINSSQDIQNLKKFNVWG